MMMVYCVIGVLGLLGVIGNVLSTIVWTRPHIRSKTAILLTALGFSDTILILSAYPALAREVLYKIPSTTVETILHIETDEIDNVVKGTYPVFWMARTMSTYITLALTVERYIAVTYPFKYQAICTHSRTLKTTATIICFAIVYNLPRFMYNSSPIAGSRLTLYLNLSIIGNPLLKFHVTWLDLFIIYLIPVAAMTICNTTICIKLKMASKMRRQMTSHQDLTSQEERDRRLTIMLVYVVIEFLICSAFDLTVFILIIFRIKFSIELFGSLTTVGIFFELFNPSANFLSYFAFEQRFRKTILEIFCSCKRKSQERQPEFRENQKKTRGENWKDIPMVKQ